MSTSVLSQSSSQNGQHKHRRRFIGPMPEKVIASAEADIVNTPNPKAKTKRRRTTTNGAPNGETSSDEDCLRDGIKAHAYQFFIGHGGKEEDWTEDEERSVRAEMLNKWRQSDWARHRTQRRRRDSGSKWVGSSFEVGNFLGVNILESTKNPSLFSASRASQSTVPLGRPSASTAVQTFVTAPSHCSAFSLDQTSNYSGNAVPNGNPSPNSSTALLRHASDLSDHATSEIILRPSLTVPLPAMAKSDGILTGPAIRDKGKGKQVQVHYAESPIREESSPAPPKDVLARTGSAVDETSAGAVEAVFAEEQYADQTDVVMRDRMLVRVSYTKAETVGTTFDENQNRVTSHLQFEDWAEFMVIWRKQRLELYEDYSLPGKEWITKHKKLAWVVPLNSQSTKLSLYSFVDLTFCIVCRPTTAIEEKSKWSLRGSKSGRNIFIFKVKSRSRAQDWMWKLWRFLGGRPPPSIEIRCPVMDTRIKVDIPDFDSSVTPNYKLFSREHVLELCMRSLRTIREYEWLVQKAINEGSSLQLAWRMETKLDWVWQEMDAEGKSRYWDVLSGLSLKQGGKPAHLEVRLQQHNPVRLHLRDGTRLDEPLAVEGYLDRIRPNTQTKRAVYLATHDGYLFSIPPKHAFPPSPPGIHPESSENISARDAEIRRGAKQILESNGASDLRSIIAIRRAFQLIPRHEENLQREGVDEDVGLWEHLERCDSDDEDKGGEEGLATFPDKPRQRMKRSFELILTSGHVVRFEAYSCVIALEWIHRLRALVTYWKKRHQVDAKQEMDLAYHGTGKPRLTPFAPVHVIDEDSAPEPPPDPQASLPELSTMFNWCVIQQCRPILKCGKLFVRKGLRGQYKHVQLVLVAGHLIQYRIKPTLLQHHRKSKTINLLDAYICSGYFAAQVLPEGQFNPDAPPTARRYQDGLETVDNDEDTLFMIWYRPHAVGAGDETGESAGAQLHKSNGSKQASIPALSAKAKVALFRTRSKLERDSWCWALSTEIDRVVRLSPEREGNLRGTGEMIRT